VAATGHHDGPDQVVVHRSCLGAIGESGSARMPPSECPTSATGSGWASTTVTTSANRAHRVSAKQVTLAWMLTAAPVVIPIPGSSRPETVLDSARFVELDLSAAELERLSQVS